MENLAWSEYEKAVEKLDTQTLKKFAIIGLWWSVSLLGRLLKGDL